MMAEEGVRGGNGSFLDRQREHLQRSKEKKAAIRAKFDQDCTFHPNTGNAAEVLMKSKHVVKLGETRRRGSRGWRSLRSRRRR